MERSPTPPQEEEHVVKVLESPLKKEIFYIHQPSHFLQQLLKSLLKCLGFHESPVSDDDPKNLNPLSCGADYSTGCNNHAAARDQDDAVPSSTSQASDPPPATTDQQIWLLLEIRRRYGRPGLTPGPGGQINN